MAAAAEQVDELEAVLESALVSGAERQTIVLDTRTRLTLDGLLTWTRSFLAEDGPRIARDTGRDGLTTSFTPTVLALLQALRTTLVARLVPCGSAACGGLGGCRCSRKGVVSYLPLGCCSPLPPGMYAGRTKIAVSGLCGLLERLARAAGRIGRFSGAVLLDVTITPFDDLDLDPQALPPPSPPSFVRVEVRGLHLRPSYLPAFVVSGGSGRQLDELVLPVRGSASADSDSVIAVFDLDSLPDPLRYLGLGDGAVFAAAEVPMALVDGETGRIVTAPPVTTWPDLRPASDPDDTGGPDTWGRSSLPQNQRWVPQSTDPVLPEDDECADTDECTEECTRECDRNCAADCGCDCGCHLGSKLEAAIGSAAKYLRDENVTKAAADVWIALNQARLLGRVGDAGIQYARNAKQTHVDVAGKLDDLVQALKNAERTAAARRKVVGGPRADFAVETEPQVAEAAAGPVPLAVEPAEDGETVVVPMPELSDEITEATITRWLKQEGDRVDVDEPLFEVSAGEVHALAVSTFTGILTTIRVQEGETAATGAALAEIEPPRRGRRRSGGKETKPSGPSSGRGGRGSSKR